MKRPALQFHRAWAPIIENLEARRLLAVDTVQTLPFELDFGSSVADSLVDKDGQGTGLTRVQANRLGNEYQPNLIDIDPVAGVLRLTTTGTSSAGGNTNADNTLVNGLETQFNASGGFKVTARLVGPLDYINTASEQGGIMFGPDQDNHVKLVAIAQNGQQYVQFMDEQKSGSSYVHDLGYDTLVSVGSFASIQTLDLQLVGDAASGTINAYYSVNGSGFVKVNATLTLSGTTKTDFFSATGRAGLIALHKNDGGPITVTYDRFAIEPGTAVAARPAVTATRPGNGQTGVRRDAFIAVDVSLPTPGAGIDTTTMTLDTVTLYRSSDRAIIPGVLNTSGGGDAIVLTPSALLDPNTSYTFEVTDGLKDTSGAAFLPFTMTFTTGALGGETDPSLAFEKINLPTASGQTYTGVTFGPDGKLYAASMDGVIHRFSVNPDGTLGAPQEILSLQTKEGGPRLVTGIVFDPNSTSSNLILWVSHNQFTDVTESTASDWTGKISKLTGANLQTVTTAVINLPRSVRDHLTNQMVFGPDGALYISQGSNTAMGAPDNAWGLRSEHLLNAAILRLNTAAVGSTPIDAKTDSGGTYNPYAPGAPLTLYATGVRNAYDLVWRNGRLFAATNGSAAGGNTPASPAGSTYGQNQRIDYATNGTFTSPGIPGLTKVSQTQSDYIFNIVKGGYYGHPNPTRGEFVLNGGNPTSGVDPNEVPAYPVGTLPDRNYRGNITGTAAATQGSAYNFGLNYSPNGILEYQGSAFNNSLRGKLLVAAYSGADEIFVLTVDSNGNVTNRQSGIAGFTHFTDPLDIVEDPRTGFVYVSEFGGQKLTLARPITPGANVSTDKPQMVFNDATTTGSSPSQKLTITNTGTSALAFPSDGLTIVGADAARFSIAQKPTLPRSIAPGESIEVFINFNATTVDDIRVASLQVKSNDPDTPNVLIPLRGIGMSSLTGGLNEPSLQQIMNLYRIPITVGDSTPNETNLNVPPISPNDEVVMPILVKDGSGPVTIEPLAVFGVGDASVPTFRFGYYTPGNRTDTTELLRVVGVNNSQSVNPTTIGETSFDPGTLPFGLYTWWQKFNGSPTVYSEDRLNQSYDSGNPRKLRFYPLKTPDGSVVPNAYVFAWEEFNNGTDQQDFVGIIRNVRAAPAGAEIGLENLDGLPFTDHLSFNRIQSAGNTSPVPDNTVHDTVTLRIRNTGTGALSIGSISASSGWTVTGAPSSIAAGAFADVTVKFVANPGGSSGRLLTGTLTINSSDADEPTTTVSLAGWWQPQNEGNDEPFLDQIVRLFGYTSSIPSSSVLKSDGGRIVRHGDEVLSPYWLRADSTLPVTVRQIAAFHSQGATATVRYHAKGSTTTTNLFTHDGDEGQSLFPHKDNGVGENVNLANIAQGSFSPSGTFGFRVDNEWSDPTRNPAPSGQPQDQGHHVRFWAVRDRAGNLIPHTYIMSMDYTGINYDFQDNVYLLTNVRPESAPATPTSLAAAASGAGIALNWNDNAEPNLAGYNIYRASSQGGTYTKLNGTPLVGSEYLDVTAPLGSTSWYYVTAVDTTAGESTGSAKVSATRTTDTTAPAAPRNLVATGSVTGISLDWANNSEADLAGYNVYRSDSLGGTYVKLNTGGPLSSSNFFDSTAPAGQVSYYRIGAVDTSGNESALSATSATRTSSDTTAPAAPTGLVASGESSGISIDWANNTEADLAGYNVYRSDAFNGTYVKLNPSPLATSFFMDSGAQAGAVSYYRVTAVDTSNNESTPAQASATRPADTTAPAQPGGLALSASGSGISLDWSNNSESDLAGYNVYRSDAANGTFTKLNAALLLQSSFSDTTAPQGVASHYRVTAVDASGNESTPATGSATRPAVDTLPPGTPSGLTATAGGSGIQLDWIDNVETDLAGYNIYRASSSAGPFTKLNTSPVTASAYLDATAPSGTSHYRVSAVDGAGNESAFATASATRTAAFSQVDIGNPVPAGSLVTISEGSDYNLLGGGNDVYGSADSFSFAYQQLSGDFDVRVRLAGMTNTNYFAKAGLMARESLTANSRNAFALATPGPNGHRFTYRTSTGGSTTSTGSGAVNYPNNWLRLVRVGNAFTGYRSTDGVNWIQLGSQTIGMGTSVFVGMAAVSKNSGATTTAQFRDLSGVGGPTPVDLPPATPTGVSATGAEGGITLTWNANGESDLAGYNVYRSSSAGGTYTKLNTSGLAAGTLFVDTTAPAGAQSFYRISAVDLGGNESAFATASATRPNPTVGGPIKINFQLSGTPAVAGYAQDNGVVFGDRGNGQTYGWNVNHTDLARDRNKNPDQLLDTLLHMRSGSNWSINVPNGTYAVKINVGDSQYATTNTVNVNGVSYWTALGLGVNNFANKTMTVTVSNGKLVVDNGGSANQTTRLNFIEITPAVASTKINFQLAGTPTVAGYQQDNGTAFGNRGNGLTYGWNVNHADLARDRNKNPNQLLDTLVHMRKGSNWSINLANGTYSVKLNVGDSQYATTNTVNINGVNYWSGLGLGVNNFASRTMTVTVSNGKLTLDNGASAEQTTRLNYIEITPL